MPVLVLLRGSVMCVVPNVAVVFVAVAFVVVVVACFF